MGPALLVQIGAPGRRVIRVGAKVASWPFIMQPSNDVNTFHRTALQSILGRLLTGGPIGAVKLSRILEDKDDSVFTNQEVSLVEDLPLGDV